MADAERYRQETVAAGEAAGHQLVYGAIHDGDPDPALLAIKYLEALQAMADGQATKIFLPDRAGRAWPARSPASPSCSATAANGGDDERGRPSPGGASGTDGGHGAVDPAVRGLDARHLR